MTPKEKAKELFDKFYSAIPSDEIGENYSSAKQCALIAVDELLWLLNEIDYDLNSDNAIIFYNEVKQEIEKL
jgi:hypothetical protein